MQSTTVLLMSCRGDLPKLDAAIFADTGWESQAVYDNVEFLKKETERAGIPLYVVSCGRRIHDDAVMSQVRGVKKGELRWASMPLHTQAPDGTKGIIRRQCTQEYKIAPIKKKLRELLGLKYRQHANRHVQIEQWFGIGVDETRRMRLSQDHWIINRYPLVQDCDPAFGRAGSVAWLGKNYPGRHVPRSACVGCPFHSNAEWRAIKQNKVEWEDAVRVDEAIRICGGMRGQVFLHRSCKPLRSAPLDEEQQALWDNECLGYCAN